MILPSAENRAPSGSEPERESAAVGAVMKLQGAMQQMPQVDLPVEHTFAPGLYIRTLKHIPAGTLIVGKAHANESIFILSKGKMMLHTPEGNKTVEAPFQAITSPGKKVGYALTDCVTTNIHITELTDLAAIEAEVIAPDPVLELEGQKCLG